MKEKTALRLEDALLIGGILPLWLPIVGFAGAWVWGILVLDGLMLLAITYRRVRRMIKLRQESGGALPPCFPPKGRQE
jgi:hypothetical protein